MANRWASLAAVADDPKPQRASKKHPAVATHGNDAGVPPAPINRAAAAVFPSPSPNSSTSAEFPALPGNSPPVAQVRPQSAEVASRASAAAVLQNAATNAPSSEGAMPSQAKSAQPKPAASKADWGYLSSERQKDKVGLTLH
jgi:hypothetical protein